MTMIDRRSLLRNSLAALALTACGGSRSTGRQQVEAGGPVPPPATPSPKKRALASAVILLYMEGGPSQIDTWDPKPKSAGAAGVKAIETGVPGLALSQYLPRLAKSAEHLAVVRSLSAKEGNHARARHLMHTGYAPAGGVEHPAMGAIVASERRRNALPGYVSIGGSGGSAGFLGAAHAPFTVLAPDRPVENLVPAGKLSADRLNHRVELQRMLDKQFAKSHASDVVRAQRDVNEQAIAMLSATEAVAFDLAKESAKTRVAYGEDRFGLGCLMARRLVGEGVPFVEVTMRGWDTHFDHGARIAKLGQTLDRGMNALLADLADRGMLEETLVVWAGDFGRTPWISDRGGRDHYPRAQSVVFAGGGVRGGQVIGQTDERGHEVTSAAVSVPDVFRSITEAVGLHPNKTRMSRAGRPLATVDDGAVIEGLFKKA